jgi:hypothetical protein
MNNLLRLRGVNPAEIALMWQTAPLRMPIPPLASSPLPQNTAFQLRA